MAFRDRIEYLVGQAGREGNPSPTGKPRHARRTPRTNRTRTARTQSGEKRVIIPYTMEPHPEL